MHATEGFCLGVVTNQSACDFEDSRHGCLEKDLRDKSFMTVGEPSDEVFAGAEQNRAAVPSFCLVGVPPAVTCKVLARDLEHDLDHERLHHLLLGAAPGPWLPSRLVS